MENATKALLIGASVLVAIVIIAIGVRILSSTSGVTRQVDTVSSELEISIYNSQFLKYEGQRNVSELKELLRLIKRNNLNNSNKIIMTAHFLNGSTIDVADSGIDAFISDVAAVTNTGRIEFEFNENGVVTRAHIYQTN